jgi:hypothetical protein
MSWSRRDDSWSTNDNNWTLRRGFKQPCSYTCHLGFYLFSWVLLVLLLELAQELRGSVF